MDGCLACDLTAGRCHLPGGRLYEEPGWVVEHCVGPLGLGTLIVKPARHTIHPWDIEPSEAARLGPLLQRCSQAAQRFAKAEQVYIALWSHAGGTPVHIHFVVQPVTREQIDSFGEYGPRLQVAMFERGDAPPDDDIERAAVELRVLLSS